MRVPRLLSVVAATAATALAVAGLGMSTAPSAHAFINAPRPLSQVFDLHSSANAPVKIYLDFLTTNTSGSKFGDPKSAKTALYLPNATYKGLDFDGNPSTFNTAERQAILTTWQTVAEDYAPFNVDVTTQAPSAQQLALSTTSDSQFGVKMFISSDTRVAQVLNAKGFTGVTWIGAMASGGAPGSAGYGYRAPSTLISTQLVDNNPNFIGQVTSHEAGHAAGLTHDEQRNADGSINSYWRGNGLMGAIMGAAYTDPISVFNEGDYPNAVTADTFNSKGQMVPINHDDFAVMAQYGLKLRSDEAGQTTRTAKAFGLTKSTQQTYGYITTRSDQDWYKFTWNCDSNLTADAEPAILNPDLDIKLTLYNGYGKVITSDNPPTRKVNDSTATGLNAKLNLKLAKGSTYYLGIDGVGYKTASTGGYSDYGSRGDYTLKANGCADNVPLPAPTITAPTKGQTIYGTLAIRGTGVPGAKVDVVANGPAGSSRSAQAGLPFSVQPDQPVAPLPDEPKSSLRVRTLQHPIGIGGALPGGAAMAAPQSGGATASSTPSSTPSASSTTSPSGAGAAADANLTTVCRGVTVAADGTWSCVPNPKLTPGSYAIAVTQTRGDRTSQAALRSFTIAAASAPPSPTPTPTNPPTTVTPTPTAPTTTVTPTVPTATISSTPPEIATVPPSQTDPNLADTGASGLDVIAVVAGVLLTGAGAMAVGRRRSRRQH